MVWIQDETAGRGKLELVFQYPEFASVTVPELDGSNQYILLRSLARPYRPDGSTDTAKYGSAPSFESKNTFNDGDLYRASERHPRTHRCMGALEERSLGWRYGSSYLPPEIYRLDAAFGAGKFSPAISNSSTSRSTLEAATEHLIEIRWESEVTGVENEDDDATLHAKTPLAARKWPPHMYWPRTVRGARCVLCSAFGCRARISGNYVIADVRMDHDYPTEDAPYSHRINPRGTVLIHKQPHDIWRIDYQLQAGEDRSEAVEEATIRNRVGAILRDIGHNGSWELEWWSIYTANTLCLDEYKHGRVIFIGDSAHIVPIFGVRGLNNGLADAYNVGWKLSYVLNEDADASLLDTYSPERRGTTLDVFANASKRAS